MRCARLAILVVLLGCAASVLAATFQSSPLPMGTPADATLGADGSAVFDFQADGAGLLSVSVYTSGDADLYLTLADEYGQSLASSDSDLGSHMGSEVLSAPIRIPGPYQVVVHSRGGGAGFRILGAWLPTPGMELPADPDGNPGDATQLTVGTPHSDSIDPDSADGWDWFSVTVADGGLVSVVVEAPEGDLALELYRDGHFGEAAERSDQDLEDVSGNEAITVRAQAGETLYFKVLPVFGNQAIAYTIRVGVM